MPYTFEFNDDEIIKPKNTKITREFIDHDCASSFLAHKGFKRTSPGWWKKGDKIASVTRQRKINLYLVTIY